jgi:hypothetical protein
MRQHEADLVAGLRQLDLDVGIGVALSNGAQYCPPIGVQS